MDTLPITTPRQAGIYVRQAREAQGITRAALAKKAGVSERLLASLELGDARAFGSTSCWQFSVLLDWRSPLKGI